MTSSTTAERWFTVEEDPCRAVSDRGRIMDENGDLLEPEVNRRGFLFIRTIGPGMGARLYVRESDKTSKVTWPVTSPRTGVTRRCAKVFHTVLAGLDFYKNYVRVKKEVVTARHREAQRKLREDEDAPRHAST